jgi:hypothetical protein
VCELTQFQGLAFKILNSCQPVQQDTPVDNMINQKDIPLKVFTCKLESTINDGSPNDNGFFTFGEIDTKTLASTGCSDFTWTPITTENGWWQIPSPSFWVNGKCFPRTNIGSDPQNNCIVDTGTSLWLVGSDMLNVLYAAIPGAVLSSADGG